ncbi:MAG: hypothetical protein FD189_16 [Elusimicrobia bacterium]|nr:MAG: hypothetical protein FD154_168 [Elusimicrobiota bacterium]KAF0158374.1 MAG: hypothetical protein FD189_16 [Elusimicrobiota bacterium]
MTIATLLFSVFFPLSQAAAQAQAPAAPAVTPAAEEAELSARMQQDVALLLEQLLGRGRSKVFVRVEGEAAYTAMSESGASDPGNFMQLPGFSQITVMEKTNEYIQQQKAETTHTSQFRMKRVTVSLVFDRNIPEARANAIRLLVTDILRLDEKRGDSISLLRADMLPWWKEFFDAPDIHRILLGSFLLTLSLASLVVFAYLLASRLFTSLLDYARMSALTSQAGSAAPGAGAQAGGGEAEGEGGEFAEVIDAGGGGLRLLESQDSFSFIEKMPAEEISEILADEAEEDAAIVIAQLADRKPHISSKLLLNLPPSRREEVTRRMLALRQVEPERLMEVENNLRLRIEKSLKGSEKLGRILSLVDPAEREELLSGLKGVDQASFDRLRGALITFDELCSMDEKNLKPLVLSLPYADWAVALQGMDEGHTRSVMKVFPEDVRAIVRDMLSARQEKEKVILARAKVIATAMDLASKNRIDIAAGRSA